mmetsp:Transcript_35180/g.111863  ORF Transcript_35180/g.111863 Transcript_35180/m.111863 type:complete len:85 (+) Transcript_35180:693-947(+)
MSVKGSLLLRLYQLRMACQRLVFPAKCVRPGRLLLAVPPADTQGIRKEFVTCHSHQIPLDAMVQPRCVHIKTPRHGSAVAWGLQ